MDISQSQAGSITILAPAGRIDSFTAHTFESTVMAVVAGGGPLVIDFAGLAYISSAGLRVLLLAMKQMRGAGGRLVLCGLQPSVREVFDISGFSGIFEIRATAGEAVDAIAAG